MKALSTNCLYYNAYVTAGRMASELQVPPDPQWQVKADRLKRAINERLWDAQQGSYRFLIGPLGACDHQEGLGASYALLFGIADAAQAESIFRHQHVTPAGLPCGWPNLPRYDRPDKLSYGRHMGTVWPQIQGFWAEAAARARKPVVFGHELFNLAAHAVRDRHFAEIYHPITGEVYGGLQENAGQGIILWKATSRQTWAATAYLRMVLCGLAGMRCEPAGVRFQPCVPPGISTVELRNVPYRALRLDITIRGTGTTVRRCTVNGQDSRDGFVAAPQTGLQQVTIALED